MQPRNQHPFREQCSFLIGLLFFFIIIIHFSPSSSGVEGRVFAVIDTFATEQPMFEQHISEFSNPVIWYSPYSPSSIDGVFPLADFQNTSDALGGQRDIIYGHYSNTAMNSYSRVSIGGGTLEMMFSGFYEGTCYIQWDGIDNAGLSFPFPGAILNIYPGIGSENNPHGDGSTMDFTFGSQATTLTFTVQTNRQMNFFLDAIDSNTQQNSISIGVPAQGIYRVDIPFTSTGWTEPFSSFLWDSVLAYQLRVPSVGNLQAKFSSLNITGYLIEGDAVLDCGCSGVPSGPAVGVKISLYNNASPNQKLISSTTTNDQGLWKFTSQMTGSYVVCVDSALQRCSGSEWPDCFPIELANLVDPSPMRFSIQNISNHIPDSLLLECGDCTTPNCTGIAYQDYCGTPIWPFEFLDSQSQLNECLSVIRRNWLLSGLTIGIQQLNISDQIAPNITFPAQNLTVPCVGGQNGGKSNSSVLALAEWLGNHGDAIAEDLCDSTGEGLVWSHNGTSLQNSTSAYSCGNETRVEFLVEDLCGNQARSSGWFIVESRPANYSESPSISPSSAVPSRSPSPSPSISRSRSLSGTQTRSSGLTIRGPEPPSSKTFTPPPFPSSLFTVTSTPPGGVLFSKAPTVSLGPGFHVDSENGLYEISLGPEHIASVVLPLSLWQSQLSVELLPAGSLFSEEDENANPNLLSVVINLTLVGYFRSQFDENVLVCLNPNVDFHPRSRLCLAFWDELSTLWKCVDSNLRKQPNGLWCGETPHFTNFALLLTGQVGADDDDYGFVTGSWEGDLILVASIIGTFAILILVVLVIGSLPPVVKMINGYESSQIWI